MTRSIRVVPDEIGDAVGPLELLDDPFVIMKFATSSVGEEVKDERFDAPPYVIITVCKLF